MNDRSFGNVSNIEALAVSRSYRSTRRDGELRSLGVATARVPNATAIRERPSRTRVQVSDGAEKGKPRTCDLPGPPGLEARTLKRRRDAMGFRASRN